MLKAKEELGPIGFRGRDRMVLYFLLYDLWVACLTLPHEVGGFQMKSDTASDKRCLRSAMANVDNLALSISIFIQMLTSGPDIPF